MTELGFLLNGHNTPLRAQVIEDPPSALYGVKIYLSLQIRSWPRVLPKNPSLAQAFVAVIPV
jgi:hypothetical protein